MTARVLVVDDVIPNVKLLEAKLTSEYFEVLTAYSGMEALEIIDREHPDIILLDVMMPGMDGFEVCSRIKANPKTQYIPVVMVTALDQISDRINGLNVGADDFLTKPVNDIALFARVKSLVRMKMMVDELRNREQTGAQLGWEPEEGGESLYNQDVSGHILVVDESEQIVKRIAKALDGMGEVSFLKGDDHVADTIREKRFDLVILSLTMVSTDGLRVCSKLRTFEETRHTPILVMVDDGNSPTLMRALEMGVNDYVVRPVDKMEFVARVKTQLRRKQYADKLWENLHTSMQLASTDAVTGLYNRHYLTSHMETQMRVSRDTGKPVSVLMLDIDLFKQVNDTYGHAVGDEVLKEFAVRVGQNVRGIDLAARFGGEEFVVMMPDTSVGWAEMIGQRLRESIEESPFSVSADVGDINITVSIGVATSSVEEVLDSRQLLDRADQALYQAKDRGRNRVVVYG